MTKEQFMEHVIRSLILEYRLSIETVSKLFNGDPNELYNRIINIKDSYLKNALIYVLDYESKEPGLVDQRKAKYEAMKFLSEFFKIKSMKEKVEMINKLNSNEKIKQIRNKDNFDYTEEEYDEILKYRYKYALSRIRISREFGIPESTMYKRDSKMEGITREKFKLLNAYNDPALGNNYVTSKRL